MNETQEKLGAHEVATWLRRHPRFLQQFPDLALSLVVPREEGSASSLASYQLEVLRDKNRELSRRLQELFGNAQENERLSVRTHQLTLALMRQTSAADTLRAMAASLAEDFNGDLVRLVLFAPVEGLADADWLQVIAADDARLAPFRDCLADGEPLCGRLQPEKHALLYGDARRRGAVDRVDGAAGRGPGGGRQPRSQPLLPGHGHAVPAHDGRVAGDGTEAVRRPIVEGHAPGRG